jgi:putative SOS response-associated peptidase YedK
MCGRFVLSSSVPEIARYFQATFDERLTEAVLPSWNVPPTTRILGVSADESGERHLDLYRWGLVPYWADGLSYGVNTINARAESVATKPSFRSAFRSRRCLIPADAYYEWKTTPGEVKQPYVFKRSDGQPLAFAGLFELWHSPADTTGATTTVLTCAIVTTEANDDVAAIHTRMPAILEPGGAWERWLDPDFHDRNELEALVVPAPPGTLVRRRVGISVGSVKNDGPHLIEEEPSSPALF